VATCISLFCLRGKPSNTLRILSIQAFEPVAPSFYAVVGRHCNLNEDEIAQYFHRGGPRKEHFTQSVAIIRPPDRSAGQRMRGRETLSKTRTRCCCGAARRQPSANLSDPFRAGDLRGVLTTRRGDLAQYAFLECRKFSWELTSDRGMIEKAHIIRQELYF
jgi:hypothetical protein